MLSLSGKSVSGLTEDTDCGRYQGGIWATESLMTAGKEKHD